LSGPCAGDPFFEGSLQDPTCITINPSGEVEICWNLPIGNAKRKALNKIITQYDWRKNRVIKTLMQEGPTGLLKFPEARSFVFYENQYVSKCQFCIEIRETLGIVN
jgi:hypothetical protein